MADVLRRMNHDLLAENRCYFGGGTAIVLRHGEYRQSLDIDFLCYGQDGYRNIRSALVEAGPHALVPPDVEIAREHKTDQYGIRMFLRHRGQNIKMEVVREGNIEITGERDPSLGVPTLDVESSFATKLLANADRWPDRSLAYRDAIDIGMLLKAHGSIPCRSIVKAEKAYGERAITRGLVGVTDKLEEEGLMDFVCKSLDMSSEDFHVAFGCLRSYVDTFNHDHVQIEDDTFRRTP